MLSVQQISHLLNRKCYVAVHQLEMCVIEIWKWSLLEYVIHHEFCKPYTNSLFLIKLSNWNLIINATTCLTLGFPPACKAQFSRNFARAFFRKNASSLLFWPLEQKSCHAPPAQNIVCHGFLFSAWLGQWVNTYTRRTGNPDFELFLERSREDVESCSEIFSILFIIVYFLPHDSVF